MAHDFDIVTLDEIHYRLNVQNIEKSEFSGDKPKTNLEQAHPYTSGTPSAPKPEAPSAQPPVPHTFTPPEVPKLQFNEPEKEQHVIPQPVGKPSVTNLASKPQKQDAAMKFVTKQKKPTDWDGAIPQKMEVPEPPPESDKPEEDMTLDDLWPRVYKNRFLEHHHFNALSPEEKKDHVTNHNPFQYFTPKEKGVLHRELKKKIGHIFINLARDMGLHNLGIGFDPVEELPGYIDRLTEEMGPYARKDKNGNHQYHQGIDWTKAQGLIPAKEIVQNWARAYINRDLGYQNYTGHHKIAHLNKKAKELEQHRQDLEDFKQKLGVVPTEQQDEEGVYKVPDLSKLNSMGEMKAAAAGMGGKFNMVPTEGGKYMFSVLDATGNPMAQDESIIGLRDKLVQMGKIKQGGGETKFDQFERLHGDLAKHKDNKEKLQPKLDELNHKLDQLNPEDADEKIAQYQTNTQQGLSDIFDLANELSNNKNIHPKEQEKLHGALIAFNEAMEGIEDGDLKSAQSGVVKAEKMIESLDLPNALHETLAELKEKAYNLSHDVEYMRVLNDPNRDKEVGKIEKQRDSIYNQLSPSLEKIETIEEQLQKLEQELPDFGKYKQLKDTIAQKEKDLEELRHQVVGIGMTSDTKVDDEGEEGLTASDYQQAKDWGGSKYEDALLDQLEKINDVTGKGHDLTDEDYKKLAGHDLSALFGSDEKDKGFIHRADARLEHYASQGTFTQKLLDFFKQFPYSKSGDIPEFMYGKEGKPTGTGRTVWKRIQDLVVPSKAEVAAKKQELGEGTTDADAYEQAEWDKAWQLTRYALKFSKYYSLPESDEDVYDPKHEEKFADLKKLIQHAGGKDTPKDMQSKQTFAYSFFTPLRQLGDAIVEHNEDIDPEDMAMFKQVAALNRHHRGGENNKLHPGTLRRKGHRLMDMLYGSHYGTHPDWIDWNWNQKSTPEQTKDDWYARAKLNQPDSEGIDFSQNFGEVPEEGEEDDYGDQPDELLDSKDENQDETAKSFVFSNDTITGGRFIFRS